MQVVHRQFYKALIYENIKISSLAVSPSKISTCFIIPATWTFFLTHLVISERLNVRLKNNMCSKFKWNSEDAAKFIDVETDIQSVFIIIQCLKYYINARGIKD